MQEKEPMVTVQNHRIRNEKNQTMWFFTTMMVTISEKILRHHLIDKPHAA